MIQTAQKKTACIHDRLVFYGGADKVFFELVKNEHLKNPDNESKIFTLVSKEKSITINGVNYKIITSLPAVINDIFIHFSTQVDTIKNPVMKLIAKLFNYRNLIVFYPILMKILEGKIKKFDPDRAIISSANISKNIRFPLKTYTKLYIHSPMMYVEKEFQESIKNFNIATKLLFRIITPVLQKRDKQFTQFDEVRANSFHTASLVKKLYNIDAQVAYPYIDSYEQYSLARPTSNPDKYYIYVGRLVKSLRHVDKIITLFNKTGERLIVIGDGADGVEIKKNANKNIEFTGNINDRSKIIDLVKNSKGYINIAYESAGMGTIEAMLLGVPVFGYNKGGTAELVTEGSGTLIGKLDRKSIEHGFETFKNTIFDRNHIKQNIEKKLDSHGRSSNL